MTKKRLPLITAIISTVVTILATIVERTVPNGGEIYPTYYLHRAMEIPALILMLVGGVTALGSYIALGIQRKAQSNVEFTRLYKFILIRRFALITAAIPGLVLTPLAIAALINIFTNQATMLSGLLLILSISSLIPGIAAMVTLLVLAVITAFKEPIDDAERPKPHLLQIFIAGITTATVAAAFFQMQINSFQTCDTACSWFNPMDVVFLALYLVGWIALAAVWLKSKRGKPTA